MSNAGNIELLVKLLACDLIHKVHIHGAKVTKVLVPGATWPEQARMQLCHVRSVRSGRLLCWGHT